ncbi:hypothetical protein EDB19DRAFT_463439 [Suillus lakei]|nr:hypothetical protein EDB19DRAFT_463439 [Suillus lakei]
MWASFTHYTTHSMLSLQSKATRRPPAGHRRPPISATPIAPRPPPTINSQKSKFLRLSKLLRFSPRTNAVHPGRHNQPRDPLDLPATSPLPPHCLHGESLPSTPLPSGRAFFNPIQSSSGKGKQKAREPKRKTAKVVDVPLGQATYADVIGVDDGTRPCVLFFCLSWFQKREKREDPRPVYDDQLEDDEEEENMIDQVAMPPHRIQHEAVELQNVASQSQPEAGPSRLAVPDEHLEAQSS